MPHFSLMAWLQYVLRTRREQAGVTLRDIEALSGVDRGNLSRFEHGAWVRRRDDLDALVGAYGEAIGRRPALLWREALRHCERSPEGPDGAPAPNGRSARGRPEPTG